MKAKEITWKGMTFRSKLEARYYNHFKNLGWDFDYEPDVPGLVGYQPDFVLIIEIDILLSFLNINLFT